MHYKIHIKKTKTLNIVKNIFSHRHIEIRLNYLIEVYLSKGLDKLNFGTISY